MNIVDKNIGNRVGKLIIDCKVDNYSMDNRKYICKCGCGETTIKSYDTLRIAINKKLNSNCGCEKGGGNIIDSYIGNKISKLTILGRVDNYSTKNSFYKCVCDCGNSTFKKYSVLLKGLKNNSRGVNYKDTVSCGKCIVNGKSNKGKRYKNIAVSRLGEKHNRLTVIDIERNPKQRGYWVVCKCDCGNTTKQVYSNIKNGKVKSCGCYGREQQSKTGTSIGLNNCTKANNKHKWHYIKNGIKIKMRSGYEVMYAMVLDKENIQWEYEPKRFKLSKGITYLPDFYLIDEDLWIDVKGRVTEKNKNKYKLFRGLGYNLNLVFIKEIEKRLGLKYRKFLKEWKKEAESNNVETPRKANASTE